MTTRLRIGLALLLSLGTIWVTQLSAPTIARACSCVPWPETVAAYRTDANVLVLAGTVVALEGQNGMFGIERVFKGPVPAVAMPIVGGNDAMCGLSLKLGDRLVLAAWVEDGVLQPSSCMPSAQLASPEGDALLADAEAAYGSGVSPPGEDAPPADPAPGPANGLALPLILGAVLAVVVLLFGAVAVLVRRGRSNA